MNFAHIVLQHDKEPHQATGDMHLGSRFLYLTMRGFIYCLLYSKVYREYIIIRIMNYSIHPQIREALKRAESVNVRGEVSIPLYRLKEELEKRRIEQQDFKDFLRIHTPSSISDYVYEVCKKLFNCPETISRDEKFLITSGLC